MEFFDVVLGVLLILGLIRGIRNGLIVEFASLFSFFIGIYVAVKFSYLLGDSKATKITAFIIVLILVVIGIRMLSKILSKIASALFLGWLNKLGGGFFGVLRTALFLGVLMSLFLKININNAFISKESQEKSLFFLPIIKTSEVLLPVLTDWYKVFKKKGGEINLSTP